MSIASYISRGGLESAGKPKEFAMTQMLNANQINLELQQKQLMMMGGLVKNIQNKLSRPEIEKMKQNYVGMYYAFVSVNWGQGMTLGMAWQKALEQMDAFVASKAKVQNHPANQDLIKYHNEFRRDMAKSIMTSEYTDEKLEERLKKSFLSYGMKRLKETKKSLDDIYDAHMPKQELQKIPVNKSFDVAKQKTMQLMQKFFLQQMMHQRAA